MRLATVGEYNKEQGMPPSHLFPPDTPGVIVTYVGPNHMIKGKEYFYTLKAYEDYVKDSPDNI